MSDNYTHTDNSIMYVEETIPGPAEVSDEYAELLSNFNSQLTDHCCCTGQCILDKCSCLQRSGGPNYILYQDKDLKLKLSEKDFKIYPVLECNTLCPCSNDCGNRLVQKGPIDGLIVKPCGLKGNGLFTNKPISKGQFICEYAGEVITKIQAMKRHNANSSEGKMNYIYCLNEHSNGLLTETFIDPSYFGNIGRYVNHSCEPNCYILPVRVDTPIPKLAIFACSDILVDTELTFNYGSHIGDSVSCLQNVSEGNRKKCVCHSSKCRGLMPYEYDILV